MGEELEGKENIIQDMQKIIYEERDNIVINENNYRNQIEILMREKESIQKKIEASESKLTEKEGLIKHMKKEITDRKTLMEKSPDIGITDLSENLIKKSEELSQLNKGLKDRNDELERKLQILSELSESQKCSNCQNGPMKDLKGEKEKQSCSLQDSGSVLINRVAMPGHVIHDRSTMSSDGKHLERIESVYDDFSTSISDSPHGSDVNENILCDNFLPCLKNTLASSEAVSEKGIVPEIEKIISQKENINKENEVLKIYQDAFAELNGQNKILVEKVQKLEALITTLRAESKSFPDLIIENDYQSINDIQRSSPDGQELDDEYHSISATINDTEQKEIGGFQKKIEMLQVERDVLVREKDDILEKNKQLEDGLDLMGSEFESMEEYWQKKMNEERELYERQIKMNEIQFKDLEVKMKEYEDLLMTMEPKQQIEADRLSTIDEKRSLEEQVNIWEEEISQLKIEISRLKKDHREEVKKLKTESKCQNEQKESHRSLSMAEKRKSLEAEWMKVIKLGKQTCVENETRNEMRRLDELKTYIQDECDKLLERRDKLQQECQSDYRWWYPQASLLPDITHCQPVTRQHRSYQGSSPAEDLSSVAHAYKAVLQDISQEIIHAESDLASHSSDRQRLVLLSLNQRLDHQVSRCQHLQSSLGLVRTQSSQAIEAMTAQHLLDISHLESMLVSAQELVRRQDRKQAEQMEKMMASHSLLERLCQDNLDIMDQLMGIKNKCVAE